jgi:ATP-binding cassette, subfamily D (ALD), peroxisomal long-chain fatty acid import protein
MGESGDEWNFQRIGTTAEKSSVEKELAELRERLAKVEEWKHRRQEIDEELNKVWTSGGEVLPPPAYVEKEEKLNDVETERLEASQASMLTAGSAEA